MDKADKWYSFDIEEIEIESIGLEISDDNEASKRMVTKNGFKKAGEGFFFFDFERLYKTKGK